MLHAAFQSNAVDSLTGSGIVCMCRGGVGDQNHFVSLQKNFMHRHKIILPGLESEILLDPPAQSLIR